MKYKVQVVMSYWQTIEVEAVSKDFAEVLALDAFDITKARMGDGEVYDTQLVFEPTLEEAAFMEAYLRNVASASRENVLLFLEYHADGGIDKDSFHWWAGVEDAWLMWQDAKKFIQGEMK